MVNMSGAEWKRFSNDLKYWPEDDGKTFYDEELFLVDGMEVEDRESVADASKVTIQGGYVFKPNGDEISLEHYIRQWRKEQIVDVIVIEVPKEKRGEIMRLLKQMGGRVVVSEKRGAINET